MSQDGVQLKLDVICDCPCKDSKSDFSNIKVPAALVDTFGAETFSCQHGVYHCGVCVCDEGYSGLMCQCESDKVLTDQCTNPDNPEVICSGEGFCNCDGKCMCNRYGNREITGTYCQYDTGFCPKGENGLPCSGHGKCNVDDYTCSCDAGWTGDACSCSTSTDACRVDGGALCHGNGICKCNSCKCASLDSAFFIGAKCNALQFECADHDRRAVCIYHAAHNDGHWPDDIVDECNQSCGSTYHDIPKKI